MIAALFHAIHPLIDILGFWFLLAILVASAWALYRAIDDWNNARFLREVTRMIGAERKRQGRE